MCTYKEKSVGKFNTALSAAHVASVDNQKLSSISAIDVG